MSLAESLKRYERALAAWVLLETLRSELEDLEIVTAAGLIPKSEAVPRIWELKLEIKRMKGD